MYRFADEVDPFDALVNIGNLNPLLDLAHLQNTKIFV
jgi:hypothetical protein